MGVFGAIADHFSQKGEHYGYLLKPGRLRKELVRVSNALANEGIDFDTIAVQGVSGLLLGAPLAAALDKGLIIVRRPGDESPLTFPSGIRGEGENKRILFLDDCTRTGATMARVFER